MLSDPAESAHKEGRVSWVGHLLDESELNETKTRKGRKEKGRKRNVRLELKRVPVGVVDGLVAVGLKDDLLELGVDLFLVGGEGLLEAALDPVSVGGESVYARASSTC